MGCLEAQDLRSADLKKMAETLHPGNLPKYKATVEQGEESVRIMKENHREERMDLINIGVVDLIIRKNNTPILPGCLTLWLQNAW